MDRFPQACPQPVGWTAIRPMAGRFLSLIYAEYGIEDLVHSTEHVASLNLRRVAGKYVSPARASHTCDQAGSLQLEEQPGEVFG